MSALAAGVLPTAGTTDWDNGRFQETQSDSEGTERDAALQAADNDDDDDDDTDDDDDNDEDSDESHTRGGTRRRKRKRKRGANRRRLRRDAGASVRDRIEKLFDAYDHVMHHTRYAPWRT